MADVLPLVGIAALMAFGFVVLIAALTYEEPLARERQRRRDRPSTPSVPQRAEKVALTLGSLGRRWVALARERWPRVRDRARHARQRWLTLESTTGQVLLVSVASLVLAYVIVSFG
jgi:hypothetical protein